LLACRSGELCPRQQDRSYDSHERLDGSGRLWTGDGFRMLHLPSVRGLKPGCALAGDAPAQADQMFTNAGLGLKAHGMCFRNVRRTWIYLARLLEWYDEFNRVRTAHYRSAGFGKEGGTAFPGEHWHPGRSGDEECLMDVLALDSKRARVCGRDSDLSEPAPGRSFNYGSAFSRGMAFEIEGRRTVHISGTASINPAGDSIHVGDAELQSLETLLCIAAILEEQGGSLANITSATLFCKNRDAWEAWKRVSRQLQIPAFPRSVFCRRLPPRSAGRNGSGGGDLASGRTSSPAAKPNGSAIFGEIGKCRRDDSEDAFHRLLTQPVAGLASAFSGEVWPRA